LTKVFESTSTTQAPALLHRLQCCGLAMQNIALAVMGGGIVALGAIAAPLLFKTLPRFVAGPLMGEIFNRFDGLLLGALLLLWCGEILVIYARQRFGQNVDCCRRWLTLYTVRLGLLLLLTGMVLSATQVVDPRIQQMQKLGLHRGEATVQSHQFDEIHHRSENLHKGSLLIVLSLLALSPFSLMVRKKAVLPD
jgi:hypothetical protein